MKIMQFQVHHVKAGTNTKWLARTIFRWGKLYEWFGMKMPIRLRKRLADMGTEVTYFRD